ncbi:hypothetical protein BDZ94DRAFT_764436 [Collybia nuda]|uniref:Uncharacterized protein n=1 Tax=Collybia nuda TaxID=64659 RepID=A0A9P6CDQ9_9AGAR|nr:hypothetical protein BDZ94DRAFT_764436 [Collybia nuda]
MSSVSENLSSGSLLRRPSLPHIRREQYVYTYHLLAGATPLQFLISVEPHAGKPAPGKYTFRLSLRVNGIERTLCEPIELKLSIDPRQLEFIVFVFPGKTSIPVGSLYSLRVWLRVNGADHRVFGDDELWVGKDLDFNSIADASFFRLKNVDSKTQIYHGFCGRALVTFIVRWNRMGNDFYRYSLDYELNGVSGNLFDDLKLRIDGDPRTTTFLIYSVPINSQPAGASHRLRIWLKSLVNLGNIDPSTAVSLPFNDSYIYQRIWKTDSFKVGARLDFNSLGNKMIMGFSSGGPQTIIRSSPPPDPPLRSPYQEKARIGYQ